MKRLLTRHASALVSLLVLGGIACAGAEATLVRDGNETFANEDWEASVEAYEQAQQEAPELTEPYYNAGNAYYRQQEYGPAQQNIENALRTAEGDLAGQANFNLGNTQYQSQQFEAAIEPYRETLRLNPDDRDAKHNLELALLRLQQEEEEQQPGQQPQGEGEGPQGEQEDQGEEQQEQQDQQPDQGESPSAGQDQPQPEPDPAEQDQPVPQPQPGELTEEQARQLLEAVASRVQTLQERLQQNVVISSDPPVKDW
jgi:tetratricopeptide (TPR) repeat protein